MKIHTNDIDSSYTSTQVQNIITDYDLTTSIVERCDFKIIAIGQASGKRVLLDDDTPHPFQLHVHNSMAEV